MKKIKMHRPCGEDFSNMDDVEMGKFCHSCQRNVIDFTEKSFEEILDFIANNRHESCGIFQPSQLDRNIGESRSVFHFPPLVRKIASISLIGVSALGTPILVNGQDIVEKVEIPAEYDSIQVKKVKTPARVITIEVPAVYDTVHVKKLVKPAEFKIVEVPPETVEITKRVSVLKGGYAEWREIECVLPNEETYPVEIKILQKRLQELGYYQGEVNNVLCDQTQQALMTFREYRGMSRIFELDDTTLKALGISE